MVEWLDAMVREAGLPGLVVLALCAGIEYVFPPFPGDTVTVFGGIYAVRGELPVAAVFAAIMAGSLLGAFADYAFGLWLGRRLAAAPHEKRWLRFISREQLLAWEERFRRRGALWLLVNRFFPGIRGPVFLAAGVSQMPVAPVLLFGGLSALVWNALLFATGYAVGGRVERLQAVLSTYGRVAWAVLIAVVLAFVLQALWRRARSRRGARM